MFATASRTCFALLLGLLVTGRAQANGIDLMHVDPVDRRLLGAIGREFVAVENAALAGARGDTLELIFTGLPEAVLRIALDDPLATAIDRLQMRLAASEPVLVELHWERAGRRVGTGSRVQLPVGDPASTQIPLLQIVGAHGWERPDAVILAFPEFVGNVRWTGDIEAWGSDAPRSVFLSPDAITQGRVVRANTSLRWEFTLPPAPRLRLDLAALGTIGLDAPPLLHCVVADRQGRTREVWFETAPTAPSAGAPGSTVVEVDLGAFAGAAVSLTLATTARSAARSSGLLFVGAPRIVSSGEERTPLLLIVIDTLRRDDPRGDTASTRPNLRALAAASLDFTSARANSSWTLPSTASLLSGLLPSSHGLGMGAAGTTRLHPLAPSIAEELRAAGWSTLAVSANPLVVPGTGLERGFETFDWSAARDPRAPSAEQAVHTLLDWIRPRVKTSWMAFLHLFDPHDPYQAPEPWRLRYVDASRRGDQHPSGVWSGQPNPLRDALVAGDAAVRVRSRDVDLLAELYRGEIAYVDHQVGVLLDSLRAWGELERSVIVVTSDHGEEFLEHGMLKHGHALHEELIAVPLLIKVPGVRPRSLEAAVSLVDVPPTLRTVLGLSGKPTDGQDLAFLWTGPGSPSPTNPSIAELESRAGGPWKGPWRSVVDLPWKWVETPAGETLFRLDHDPAERENLHARHGAVSHRLRAYADSVAATGVGAPPAAAMDARQVEALRALGYIE